jgi:Fe2+ or Zn2+ uptake regulation protein
MSTYSEKALHLLKERGYRMTNQRRLVIETLEESDAPLSPYDIRDILKSKGVSLDAVSIYRIIDCLEENHLVHRMMMHYGKVLKCRLEDEHDCSLVQTDHCHHFLICRKCNSINEMHCVGLQPFVNNVATQMGFRVENHHLELMGLCHQCCKTMV